MAGRSQLKGKAPRDDDRGWKALLKAQLDAGMSAERAMAMLVIEAKAAELRKAHPDLSPEASMVRVLEDEPQLYDAYQGFAR